MYMCLFPGIITWSIFVQLGYAIPSRNLLVDLLNLGEKSVHPIFDPIFEIFTRGYIIKIIKI